MCVRVSVSVFVPVSVYVPVSLCHCLCLCVCPSEIGCHYICFIVDDYMTTAYETSNNVTKILFLPA